MSRLIFSAVLLLSLPAALQSQNLVTNGDFADDLSGWDLFGDATVGVAWSPLDAGGSVFSGSAAVTNTDPADEPGLGDLSPWSQCLALLPNALYELGATVRIPGGASPAGHAALTLHVFPTDDCSGSSELSGRSIFWSARGKWEQLTSSIVTASAARSGSLRPGVHKDAGGGSLQALFDDIFVREKNGAACAPDAHTLCLNGNRFEVTIEWVSDAASGDGNALSGEPLGVTSGGLFWFFSADNPEVLVKVVDLCAVLDHYGVFVAATTNVEYHLTVRDTVTGMTHTYDNTLGLPAEPVQDNATFAVCG